MRPFFFGSSKQPLFGIYHAAAAKPARRTAVLLCSPFGQEAIFAHRIFRVMADRLSRAGFPVMRFDYYATGDSSGDCGDATLARWVDDVITAGDELTDTAGVQNVAWVGLRLGATIAALASAHQPVPREALVLWEPIVDGPAYLEELRRAHLKLLADDLEFAPPHPFAAGTADTIEIDQAAGFALPPALRQDIRALEAGRLAGFRARQAFVVAGPGMEGRERLQAVLQPRGEQVSWHTLGESESWNSERSLNSSVIPVAGMNAVIGCLEGLR